MYALRMVVLFGVLVAVAILVPRRAVQDDDIDAELSIYKSRVDDLARVVALNRHPQLPRSPDTVRGPLIVRELYTARLDASTKQVSWIAYTVDPGDVGGAKRPRNWADDPSVDPGDVLDRLPGIDDDYAGATGVDRGHLRALDLTSNHPAWRTVNFYSVIGIQTAGSNRGPIKSIEARIKDLSGRRPFVVVLPTYDLDFPKGPALPNADEEHDSPTGWCYVVRYNEAIGGVSEQSVLCWAVPQDGAGPINQFACSIERVEQLTGVDL